MGDLGTDRRSVEPSGTTATTGREDVAARLEGLLKELRAQIRDRNAMDAKPAESEVMFEVESGDLRCVVLRSWSDPEAPSFRLSPREREIARMVAKGYPNKTIATILEISPWTVSTHLRRLFAKLRVTSRAAMVAKWLERT